MDAVALTQDSAGRALAGVNVWQDADSSSGAAVIRIVLDRLLDSGFDAAPAMPTCPP